MKKTALSLFLLLLTLTPFSQNLKEAIEKGLINAKFYGLPEDNPNKTASYYGKSLGMEIKNVSSKPVEILLEPGQFLVPDDTLIQKMMVTSNLLIVLKAGQSGVFELSAFCLNMYKHSPRPETRFIPAQKAQGPLLELANLICKNNFNNYAAQNAIWCLTNDADIYAIYDDNEQTTKLLREFISQKTGKKLYVELTKPSKPSKANIEHTLADTIRYSNREGGNVSLILFNEVGEEKLVWFKDRPTRQGTQATLNYSLIYSALPVGKYYIRLIRNGSEIIYQKEIVINEE